MKTALTDHLVAQPHASDLPHATVAKAYGHWAAVYDALCAPVFRPAHRAAAEAANRVGGRILEVGVGTGLLLPLYNRDLQVTGLDISEQMLAKARQRLRRMELPHVMALEAGDIHTINHPDASYDAIVFPFVLTLLAAPETALDNCRRMLRPGGEIIVVSHFQSQTPGFAAIENWLAPRIAGLGLRPDFPVDRIRDWAARHGDMEVQPIETAGPFGVYKRIRIVRPQVSVPAVI